MYRFLEWNVHEMTHFEDAGMWSHQNDDRMLESFRRRMQNNLNRLLREMPLDSILEFRKNAPAAGAIN
jgi:hypothetical protein